MGTMELSVFERLMLLQVIPVAHQNKRTGFLKQRTLRDLLRSVGFTERELTEWSIEEHPDGRVTWDEGAAEPVEIELGEIKREMVLESLHVLDVQEQITPQLWPLYERFDYESYVAELEAEDDDEAEGDDDADA